jgi:hypothetical protein
VTRDAIAATLQKLPPEARAFAIDRCVFVSVGKILGITLPARLSDWPGAEHPEWLIILEDDVASPELEPMIAHEIAHGLLGHDYFEQQGPNVENEAARLAASWGFTGRPTQLLPE